MAGQAENMQTQRTTQCDCAYKELIAKMANLARDARQQAEDCRRQIRPKTVVWDWFNDPSI